MPPFTRSYPVKLLDNASTIGRPSLAPPAVAIPTRSFTAGQEGHIWGHHTISPKMPLPPRRRLFDMGTESRNPLLRSEYSSSPGSENGMFLAVVEGYCAWDRLRSSYEKRGVDHDLLLSYTQWLKICPRYPLRYIDAFRQLAWD